MAVGAFAEGLVTGFVQGKKMKQQREKHDLEMARAQDEKDMRDAFKAVDKEHEVEERFSVATADGEQIFTDLAAAQEVAGKDGAVQALFSVAGTSYEDMHSAQLAQDMVNSPSSRMGQYAAIAMHYGRPEMATQFHGAQVAMQDAQRRTMQEAFMHARRTGDIEGIIGQINHLSGPNGPQTQLVSGEGGGVVMQRVSPKDGSVISQQPFQDLEGVWNHINEDMMQTPDNMLAVWTSQRNMEHMREQFEHRKAVDAQQLANAGGQLALGWANHNMNATKPFGLGMQLGVDPGGSGESMATGTYFQRDPKTGEVSAHATPAMPLGINPRPTGVGGAFGDIFGMEGADKAPTAEDYAAAVGRMTQSLTGNQQPGGSGMPATGTPATKPATKPAPVPFSDDPAVRKEQAAGLVRDSLGLSAPAARPDLPPEQASGVVTQMSPEDAEALRQQNPLWAGGVNTPLSNAQRR